MVMAIVAVVVETVLVVMVDEMVRRIDDDSKTMNKFLVVSVGLVGCQSTWRPRDGMIRVD